MAKKKKSKTSAAEAFAGDRQDSVISLDAAPESPANPRSDSPPRSPARERIPSPPPDTEYLVVPENPPPASLSAPSHSPPHAPTPSPPPSSRKTPGKRRINTRQRKKQKGMQEKLSILSSHLHPIPFAPIVTKGDVHKHEGLYRALGLWDFIVQAPMALETEIRTDLIAQLIANYNHNTRSSTAAGTRIIVSRTDLARALHLPSKKGQQEIKEAELELFGREDSMRSLTEFIGNWFVVVQEGILPQEIVAAEQQVKSGQAHKVDWAGLIWTEVEKELNETPKPGDCFNCYYASHLQCLIRHQKPAIMLQPTDTWVEIDPELGSQAEQEHDHACLSPVIEEEDGEEEEEEEEEAHAPERMKVGDAALDKEKKRCGSRLMFSLSTRPCEVNGGEQLVSDGRNLGTEHSMQRCSTNTSWNIELKDLVQEEAKAKRSETKHGEDLAAKLASRDVLLSMEVNAGHYCSTLDPYANKVHDEEAHETEKFMGMGNNAPPKIEVDYQLGSSHLCPNEDKKGFLYGEDIDCFTQGTHQSKRMRSDENWVHGGLSVDYMEYIQILIDREKMANDQNINLHMQIQRLNKELHEKDALMNNLEKRMMDRQQRTELEFNRCDHEIQVLVRLVNGYKNALKQSRSAFAEYRKQFPGGEEPLYKDVPGNGGILLSINELERRRLQNEKEICQKTMQMFSTFENACLSKLNEHNTSLVELIKRMDEVDIEIQQIKAIGTLKRLSP